MEGNVVSRTSILLGTTPDIESLVPRLQSDRLVANWQKLYPAQPNTARILIVVEGVEQDYQKALAAVIAAAAQVQIAWRHDDFLTYGNPNNQTWIPPLP
jgi:hypothetical protein